MIVIQGNIRNDLGKANLTMQYQLPHLIRELPDLSNIHPGTINVLLDDPLRILNPDHLSKTIFWVPGNPTAGEKFALTKIHFELIERPGQLVTAWIYAPEYSPHRHDVYHVEVISRFIDLPKGNRRCRIHINRDAVKGYYVK